MARTIAIANQKGGVAKTTTAIALGAAIAESGARVLLVDLDPQASLSYSMGLDPDALDVTIHD
ncbi:MAG: ParA family protein, partial [Actinomycetota bacterium]